MKFRGVTSNKIVKAIANKKFRESFLKSFKGLFLI